MQRGSRINTIWPIWLVCPERRGAKVTGTVGLGDADELEDATCCFPRTALPVLGCPGCIACCTKVKVTGYLPTYLPIYSLALTLAAWPWPAGNFPSLWPRSPLPVSSLSSPRSPFSRSRPSLASPHTHTYPSTAISVRCMYHVFLDVLASSILVVVWSMQD